MRPEGPKGAQGTSAGSIQIPSCSASPSWTVAFLAKRDARRIATFDVLSGAVAERVRGPLRQLTGLS
ncbi:hypothetical protein DTO164E3_1176 [Paecilomyces variotii]|nr:hypothetical protein DTO164E3_1176 [Paecilomyces variotii]